MTAATRPEQVGATPRLPVRPATDADFSAGALAELAATAQDTADHVNTAVLAAANQVRLWRLPCESAAAVVAAAAASLTNELDDDADLQLLRRFETSDALRPPVCAQTVQLDPLTALAWLLVARRWAEQAVHRRDWRYLNTACKVLGAVWHQCDEAAPADAAWREPHLLTARAVLAHRIIAASSILRDQHREPHPPPATTTPAPQHASRPGKVKTVLLARLGSATAIRFLQQAAARDVPIAGTCWYNPPGSRNLASNYTDAWYPPEDRTADRPPEQPPDEGAATWDDVMARLRRTEPDIVVLLGMPIVPERVLKVARLGVLNAHNGALPGYRGMDAVGWAILNGDPVTCTVHHATPHVDAGAVIASAVVATLPWTGLRERVKATQLDLLLTTIQAANDTGDLPTGTVQPGADTRLWFRMHPHLKRMLDRLVISQPSQPTRSSPHHTQGADA